MTLLLTSAGMIVADEIYKILPKSIKEIKLAHIVTAANPEEDKSYMVGDKNKLIEAGFQVEDIDIAVAIGDELERALVDKDIIYVQGGNTFYLLHHARKSGFDKIVKKLVENGVIYVGVSAGSILASPTIQVAAWKGGDVNEVGITDLTALGLVDFDIFVHYDKSHDEIIKEALLTTKYPLKIIDNNQAVFIKDNIVEVVGASQEIII